MSADCRGRRRAVVKRVVVLVQLYRIPTPCSVSESILFCIPRGNGCTVGFWYMQAIVAVWNSRESREDVRRVL